MSVQWDILVGDCRDVLDTLPAQSVQTCVTSPPYFGLRDYGHDGQIGLEPTPAEFVEALVEVFRGVRRVLRDDGTVWLNLGDSYAGGGVTQTGRGDQGGVSSSSRLGPAKNGLPGNAVIERTTINVDHGCKPKDLIGIPWAVAFALRADGWYLRSEIIWHKPNPMPESVTDRPTKAHEQVFLLAKSPRYYYDAETIAEIATYAETRTGRVGAYQERAMGMGGDGTTPTGRADRDLTLRNKRTVWTVPSYPFAGAHFATFPPALIEPCVLAGAPEGGLVLDPFNGAGTTGMVAVRNRRQYIGIELNPEYADLARDRIATDIRLGHRAPQRVEVDDAQVSIFDGLEAA